MPIARTRRSRISSWRRNGFRTSARCWPVGAHARRTRRGPGARTSPRSARNRSPRSRVKPTAPCSSAADERCSRLPPLTHPARSDAMPARSSIPSPHSAFAFASSPGTRRPLPSPRSWRKRGRKRSSPPIVTTTSVRRSVRSRCRGRLRRSSSATSTSPPTPPPSTRSSRARSSIRGKPCARHRRSARRIAGRSPHSGRMASPVTGQSSSPRSAPRPACRVSASCSWRTTTGAPRASSPTSSS